MKMLKNICSVKKSVIGRLIRVLELSNRIVKSCSKSPDRYNNSETFDKDFRNTNGSISKSKLDINNNHNSKLNDTNKTKVAYRQRKKLRKSSSPNKTQEIKEKNRHSNICFIDLRNTKNKKQKENTLSNPPMIFTSRARKEPDYSYLTKKNPKRDVIDGIRKSMLTYDFNKQYLSQK